MLFLKRVESEKKCDIEIDYYVPITITVGAGSYFSEKIYWRTGNFKNSLIEISIEKEKGTLKDITLVAVNEVYLIDFPENECEKKQIGVPLFMLDGNTRNGFCDQIIDFFVYLSPKDITIKFQKEIRPVKCVQLGRVRFSFDKEEKLICITVFDLSDYEYCELKAGMKIEI